jgi:hypothetical protein
VDENRELNKRWEREELLVLDRTTLPIRPHFTQKWLDGKSTQLCNAPTIVY